MASQIPKQRSKNVQTPTIAPTNKKTGVGPTRRDKKMAMAKKGLRSLTLAIVLPLTLTFFAIYLSGCSVVEAQQRPPWHPPIWAFHLASISTASLMGLSSWLVWAAGGFHRDPAPLLLYAAQLLLGLMWGPIVFGLGAVRAGLLICMLLVVSLFGCQHSFWKVNRVAGDLVKPCLAWVAFLAVFNYKLI